MPKIIRGQLACGCDRWSTAGTIPNTCIIHSTLYSCPICYSMVQKVDKIVHENYHREHDV